MPSGIYKRISGINYFPEIQGFQKGNSGKFKSTQGFSKGDKHYNWKGYAVRPGCVHIWLRRTYGNPVKCEDCGKIGKKVKNKWNIDWSNIDHMYHRRRYDYKGRCSSCHTEYDRQFNNKKNQ